MERYFKRKSMDELTNSSLPLKKIDSSSKEACLEIKLDDLPGDPGLRTRIWDYHPTVLEQVRRAYLQRGPCQPRNYNFPQKNQGGHSRRFNPAWFGEFPTWLEYSIAKDAAFCVCCYLFKPNIGYQAGGDSFVGKGFSNWKKKERLQTHVGGPNSPHNQAWSKCEALLNQNQAQREFQTFLDASIACMKFLLRQGLLFCQYDEYEDSNDQEIFLDLLRLLCDCSKDVQAATLKKAPDDLKLTSPDFMKDIVSAISIEIINSITRDIGNSLFAILIDEFHDVSEKQMTIMLRFLDKGRVIERFLGVVDVTNTTALSLKATIDDFFSSHGLSMSKLRGQAYGGEINMQGEFNSLKTLMMKENECAFHVHCFSHDLHSALIDMATNPIEIASLFYSVGNFVNVVGAFVKCHDTLLEKHGVLVSEALNTSESLIEQGINESSSKFETLMCLFTMFSSVIDVLEIIAEVDSEQAYKAEILLDSLQSFEFVFTLHMMITMLGVTNDFSQALQRKDHDIVNAMNLVRICREKLQMLRESGWNSLLDKVSSFCDKHHIQVHNMDDMFLTRGRKKSNARVVTNMHHYCVELFYTVIDMQIRELDNRFTETNTDLLLCVACLNPSDSFSAFDKQKLICLAQYYPNDFSAIDFMILEDQLGNYIMDMRSSVGFSELKGIADLAQKMVETRKDQVYPLVYLLLTLALILPVATPSVERMLSAMKIVKNRLSNGMEDQWMKGGLIAYIERDILDSIDNEVIMQRFENMKLVHGNYNCNE